eukprot:CAMPEP_0114657590 /NCGR_PEP_ID=MMETSP0191-20121206/14193_1 /TAXON_ID=126664 /ORGANISM="Sorites sp." /LENGTH=152 /DNA_ID=CAMNT_0001877351 /DNA_START=957 /DNA_END=1415 /DNA_ORIENTATION=-
MANTSFVINTNSISNNKPGLSIDVTPIEIENELKNYDFTTKPIDTLDEDIKTPSPKQPSLLALDLDTINEVNSDNETGSSGSYNDDTSGLSISNIKPTLNAIPKTSINSDSESETINNSVNNDDNIALKLAPISDNIETKINNKHAIIKSIE